jgi:hypothetical protein
MLRTESGFSRLCTAISIPKWIIKTHHVDQMTEYDDLSHPGAKITIANSFKIDVSAGRMYIRLILVPHELPAELSSTPNSISAIPSA